MAAMAASTWRGPLCFVPRWASVSLLPLSPVTSPTPVPCWVFSPVYLCSAHLPQFILRAAEFQIWPCLRPPQPACPPPRPASPPGPSAHGSRLPAVLHRSSRLLCGPALPECSAPCPQQARPYSSVRNELRLVLFQEAFLPYAPGSIPSTLGVVPW